MIGFAADTYSLLQWKGLLNYFVKINWRLTTGWIQFIFISWLSHDNEYIFIWIKFLCMHSFVGNNFLKNIQEDPFITPDCTSSNQFLKILYDDHFIDKMLELN